MRRIVLVINNVRSAHNVGAIFRSADTFAVDKIYICGYSPYPEAPDDQRLPHIRQKMAKAIHKTALGAEQLVPWEFMEDINSSLKQLADDDFSVTILEQTPEAVSLREFQVPDKIALVLGNEITGVEPAILDKIKSHVQIPMLGQKESLNVAAAAAIALYHLRYS